MVEAIYAGASTGWALDNGFVQADKYEYRREVAITELTNVYEEQRDLIFDLWRENRTPAAEAYRRPRIGVYVTIAGQEHRARSIDDSGIVVLTDRRQVAAGECERVVDVVTLASHLELECEVTAINADGSACLRLCGDDRFAETRGFTRTDSGGWTKSADLQSLMHYRERHRPLAGTGRR
ncbi:MAG TPA: hypothetical protein VM677_05435 [Actinokineospora sp.]|nr:hypothetical protein [Actinokineospora sp.]